MNTETVKAIRCQQNIDILEDMIKSIQKEADDFQPEYGRMTFADRIALGDLKDKINALQEAVKSLVVQGLLEVGLDNGYVFSITDTGSKYIKKLKSEYAVQYKTIAADAIKRFKDYSDLQLDRMINDSAVKSVRGGR